MSSGTTKRDIKFMKAALNISRCAIGYTEPNPLVGAVVVKGNKIISTGYHKGFGCDHAEVEALKNVLETGTTLYVTLEPCPHHGKTPPCTTLLQHKKVRRVVVAMQDPNPQVNGRGIKLLRGAGIQVDVGILSNQASHLNRHYLKFMNHQLPYVALKAGVSLDGKLTDKNRHSQWITDGELRDIAHGLRGEFSAVMVGVKTVLADNPGLNIRQEGWTGKQLYRIVLDYKNILDTGLEIFKDQERFPLVIFSSKAARSSTKKVDHHYFVSSEADNKLSLNRVLDQLYRLGIASVMVEGGGTLIDSFLKEDLWDEFLLFQAGKLIGGEESVQLFASGKKLSASVQLKRREVYPLQSGTIIRGFK